jgi:hypothetical protein
MAVSPCILTCNSVPALARQRKRMLCPSTSYALAWQRRYRIAGQNARIQSRYPCVLQLFPHRFGHGLCCRFRSHISILNFAHFVPVELIELGSRRRNGFIVVTRSKVFHGRQRRTTTTTAAAEDVVRHDGRQDRADTGDGAE